MITKWKILLILIIIGVVSYLVGYHREPSTELRSWRAIDGKYFKANGKNKVEAEFVSKSYNKNTVTLKLKSGQITVPKDALSEQDQKFTDPGSGLRMFGTLLCFMVFLISIQGGRGGGSGSAGGCGTNCGGGCGGGE